MQVIGIIITKATEKKKQRRIFFVVRGEMVDIFVFEGEKKFQAYLWSWKRRYDRFESPVKRVSQGANHFDATCYPETLE